MTLTEQSMTNPSNIAAQAEEVRAYIVATRGGAPFLSAADGRLLVRWLEAGISVAKILAAIDEVAIKRRKKRARGRLSLVSCRRIVEGKKDQPVPTPASEARPIHAFEEYAQALLTIPIPAPLELERERLIQRIQSAMQSQDPEQIALDALAAVRTFHENAWIQAAPRHAEIRSQARQELESLRAVLSGEAFEGAVEEVSRDIIRREFPLVSATAVWDRLSGK